MKMEIVLTGPNGSQKISEHDTPNFHSCVKKTIESLKSMDKCITELEKLPGSAERNN